MHDEGEDAVVRQSLDVEGEEPAAQIATTIAEMEGKKPTELPNMWQCTDDMLENLFSDPPDPEARMRISFTYEGYRISVDQDGMAEFRPTDAT